MYSQFLTLFQVLAGGAFLVGGAFTLLAVASVHPDNRREEVIPIGLLSGFLEVLIGLVLVFMFRLSSSSLVSLIIMALLMLAAVCQAALRVYFLETMRTLFTKVRSNGR